MKREETKSLLTRVAGVGAVALTGVPLVSLAAQAAAGRVFEVFSKSRKARAEALIAYALHGDNDEELADRLNAAIANEDPDVMSAFVQSMRAATDAITPVVIPSMAMLFRRSFAPALEPLPVHRLKRYVRLLENVTATEYGELATFLHGVLKAPELLEEPDCSAVPVTAAGHYDDGIGVQTARVYEQAQLVCVLRNPDRIFELLLEHRLADDRDGEGGVMIDFALIRPLAEVMPAAEKRP